MQGDRPTEDIPEPFEIKSREDWERALLLTAKYIDEPMGSRAGQFVCVMLDRAKDWQLGPGRRHGDVLEPFEIESREDWEHAMLLAAEYPDETVGVLMLDRAEAWERGPGQHVPRSMPASGERPFWQRLQEKHLEAKRRNRQRKPDSNVVHPPPPAWSRDTMLSHSTVAWPFWQRLKTALLIALGGTVHVSSICHTENEVGRTEGVVTVRVEKRWPWERKEPEVLEAHDE